MLAQSLEPPGAIILHPILTVLSALVATLITSVALATTDRYALLSHYIISPHRRLSLLAQRMLRAVGMPQPLTRNFLHRTGSPSSPRALAEAAMYPEPSPPLESAPLTAHCSNPSNLSPPLPQSHCHDISLPRPFYTLSNSSLSNRVRVRSHLVTFLRAVVWATPVVCMHYFGTKALDSPSGRFIIAPLHAISSTALGFCTGAFVCITMDLELDFSRKFLCATLMTTCIFVPHCVSVLRMKFITLIQSYYEQHERSVLLGTDMAVVISVLAVSACFISIGLLAYTASVSRRRMLELVNTKRRLGQLSLENETVARLAELKQNFISVASHELRTPLFSVTGYAELLSRTDLNNEQKWYLSNMQQACSNMQLIIANVLDFSKLERNNAESCAKPILVNLRTLLEGIAQMTEDRGQLTGNNRAVDLIVHVADNVPETTLLDETFLMRICMNLLSNALKFTERGLIMIEVETRSTDTLVLKVQDTGIGIPHSFMDSLFEPYRQADSSATRPHQGTGLGLSICKQLVERLHGTIEVESQVGQGSTFTVALPLNQPSDPPHSISQVRRQTICLAYTEKATEDKLHQLLTKAGHHTIRIHEEFEVAQRLLGNGEVDLVLTDACYLHSSQLLRSYVDHRRESNAGFSPCSESLEHHHLPTIIITSSTELGKKYHQNWLNDARNVIKIRRQGIIPHLIFNLLSDVKKYAHEIDLVLADQESVGAMTSSSASSLSPSAFGFGSPPNLLSDSPLSSPSASHTGQLDVTPVQLGSETEIEGCDQPHDAHIQVPSKSRSRILLVDDNPINIQLGKRFLDLLGYEVGSASDGYEAVTKACGSDWDLILMDCQMPGLDGKTATRLIREHEGLRRKDGNRAVPIIALTANVSESDQSDCKLSGMDGFLPKPLQMNVLKSTLHTFLG